MKSLHPLVFACMLMIFPSLPQAHAQAGACGNGGSGKHIPVSPGGQGGIQAALNLAQPGDTILVKPGVYQGNIEFRRGGSGNGKCIVLQGEPGAAISGGNFGFLINNKNYIAIVGFEIKNQKSGSVPTGIKVQGSSSHLEIRNNVVHHVESRSDAHGMSFYGTSSTPMTDLLVDGNEIHHCKLGQSESMVFNGNVTKVMVSHNKIHDNDNIGIDFIGFEGKGPNGQDQARDSICTENEVYNISVKDNPTYGPDDRTSDGIYVDGGKGITITNNKVDNCDRGIEVSCEHAGLSASGVSVKQNQISNSYDGNIIVGSDGLTIEDKKKGVTTHGAASAVVVEGNTMSGARVAEIIVQNHVNGLSIKNNQIRPAAGIKGIMLRGSGNSNLLQEGNNLSSSQTDLGEGLSMIKDASANR